MSASDEYIMLEEGHPSRSELIYNRYYCAEILPENERRLFKNRKYGKEISKRKYEYALEIIKLFDGTHIGSYIDGEFVDWYFIDSSIIINSREKTAPEIVVLNATLNGLEKTLTKIGL